MARVHDPGAVAVLDAAERLVLRFGYRRMTIDDVARDAGIGKGSIYLHFDSKEEIALAVVNRWSERVFDQLTGIAAESRPAPDRLLRMLEARVLGRFDQSAKAEEGIHELFAAIRPALLVQRERLLEAEAGLFVPPLRALAPQRRLSGRTLMRVARSLLTGTNWLLPYYRDPSQRGSRADLRRQTRDVAVLLIAGASHALRRNGAVR